ncbi:alpha/beta hydrolase fold protein [Xylogone sp. PMI_703]|nr:alpha/beta hydrolase fold protein [Xylogone sp. PMI_703]
MEPEDKSIFTEIPPPMPKVLFPLSNRINWCLKLYLCKVLASIYTFFQRHFDRSTPTSWPTLVKRYPCRPMLENRIFFPPNYQSGICPLPLYLNMHGGGFAFGEPRQDDEFCVSWAKRTGMLVVSIDYRKAPLYPFPAATYDIAAVANAVLQDETLPIDKSCVAIGGFSAGGSLALSASQMPGLKGIIKAAVVYYPVVDFSVPPNEKLEARPYKSGRKDRFGDASWWLDWGYIRVGQNRRDALLSPCYARKEDLPPWIYIIGAQWDMFRLEAQNMVHKLAGLEARENQEVPFEKETYKWTLALGCSHGFTHSRKRKQSGKSKNELKSEEIYREAHEWLKKSVLIEYSSRQHS